jgi:SulP family sulfate permease
MKTKLFNRVKNNLASGITVSLVSIPLAISLSIASQVSPIAGIITAIWAGLAASIIGSSNYNIIGPTGALSGIIALYSIEFGANAISMIAITSGLFIFLAYLFRLEKFLIFIPSSVIHGFTLGVAFIICMGQINYALGLNLPKHENFFLSLSETINNIQNFSLSSFFIFSIFLISLFLLRKIVWKIPTIILLSPVGILLGYLTTYGLIPLKLETLYNKFGSIEAKIINFPSFYFENNIIIPALLIAFIAILETLLSAKIADSLTHTRHNTSKELFGLSIANILSGIMGGIPATAALARTALNIKTGATNKMSATISSIFIIVWSFLFIKYFKFLPMAVIAAILVYIAVNMIEKEHFDRLFLHDKKNFFIAIIVSFITIYKDPIIGIILGVGLSLLIFVEQLSHAYYEITDIKHKEKSFFSDDRLNQILIEQNSIIYTIKGKLVYINSQAHLTRFESEFAKYQNIIVEFNEVYFIDIDGVDIIDEIIDLCEKRNQKLFFVGIKPHIKLFLEKTSKHFKKHEKEGFVFDY